MATKEETEIQKAIMLELSKYGIVIRQQSGNFYTEYGSRIKVGFTGLSDLQFISDNGKLIVFMEVKTGRKGSKPSDEQINFINFINAKKSPNLKAGIVRNVQEALQLINKMI